MNRLALLLALLVSIPGLAAAEEGSGRPPDWLWVKQRVAFAVFPSGLISDTRIQLRTAGLRTDSIVFQNTHFGAGARVAVTPAFVDVGGHFTLAPIDVFDMDLRVGVVGTFKGAASIIPFAKITDGTLDPHRKARKDEWASGLAVYASAAPTLKVKLGPMIIFDAWTLRAIHQRRPEGETRPFRYDAFQDLVVAWDDVTIQQQVGVLGEILDGKKTAVTLRLGGLLKDTLAARSKDRSTSVGFFGTFKPGRKAGWPTIAAMVLGYLTDNDRKLGAPNVTVLAQWDLVTPLQRRQGRGE